MLGISISGGGGFVLDIGGMRLLTGFIDGDILRLCGRALVINTNMKNQKRDTFIVLFIGIASYVLGISAPFVSKVPNDMASAVSSRTVDKGTGGDGGVERLGDPCSLSAVICFPEARNAPVEKSIETSKDKVSILKQVCLEGRIIARNCWKTLLAMHLVETGGDCGAVGDSGRSFGCFQIRKDLHALSIGCYGDLGCSAKWTLERMKRFGYPTYASNAIRRHNGGGQLTYEYLRKVNAIKEKL